MKRRSKRLATVLLAAILLLGLTACGEKGATDRINWVTAPAYTAEEIALPVETGDLTGCCTDGTYMYILADEKVEKEVHSVLCRVLLANGTAEEMDGYQPSNIPENTAVSRLGPVLAPDGTLWLYEIWYVSSYDLPEDFDGETDVKGKYLDYREEFHHLRQLDPVTGQQKSLVDLSDAVRALAAEDSLDGAGVAVDGGGNVYFAWNGGIAVLDKEGTCLFTLEAELPRAVYGSAGGRLVLLPDGTVAALVLLPNGKREVRTIDAAAGNWGEASYSVPNDITVVYGGQGMCLFCYIRDSVLYGVEDGEMLPQRLLPLADTGLDGYSGMTCFALLDEGRAALLTCQIPSSGEVYDSRLQLALLSPTSRLPGDGKLRLIYGDIGVKSYTKYRIEQFNKASDTHYIEYRDYSEGAMETADTNNYTAIREAAYLRLAAEIAAGRAPDIMSSSLPLDVYARAGYLEDLWPWIDSDPEISRDGLMSHVLECASIDGKLYTIGNSFTIETAVVSRSAAGDRNGWSLEEMQATYGGTMPAIYGGSAAWLTAYNADATLRTLLYMDLDRYVDWDTGTCRFNSEDFRDLLCLCASAGTEELVYENDYPPLWEGEPTLCQVTLSNIRDLAAWDVAFGGPETLSPDKYEATLWDAGVLYTSVHPSTGEEITNYSNAPFVSNMEHIKAGHASYRPAAGMAYGVPDGKIYASFVGVPTGEGTGSSFGLSSRIAISASSQAKEGAWAFVRSLLLPGGSLDTEVHDGEQYSSSFGFPINRSDFETLLEPRWCRVDEDGELILDKDGQPIEAPADMPIRFGDPIVMAAYQMAPSQAQLDRFWNLYNAIDRIGSDDWTLVGLIAEQAQSYFVGDKSLEETADLIQRRVSLYVNENR